MGVSLAPLLERHILKEDIRSVNRGLGIRVSGTKAELTAHLLAETDGSPKGTLRLFNKPVLQEICRKVGISPSGTKEELVSRIVDAGMSHAAVRPEGASKMTRSKEAADDGRSSPAPRIRLISKGEGKRRIRP